MPRIKPNRNRALDIAVIIALVFGAYFIRHFFSLIIFAVVITYLFNPIYQRQLRKHNKKQRAAAFTLIISLLAFIIPFCLIVLLCFFQAKHALDQLNNNSQINLGSVGQSFVDGLNHILSKIPGTHPISLQQLQQAMTQVANEVIKSFINVITSTVSGLTGFITDFIIYLYIFINLLVHQDTLIEMIKGLNPLGRARSEAYLNKMGSMTKGMAKGQFIIATVQGFTDALLLYIAGLRSVFLFMFIILTVLSIIPLGGGVIVIPIGIVMLLTGHIWQGAVVLLGHFLIVTNEDNVLRPKLVPKESYLNPALTLLAVFAGVGMFGFLGIIIGPVIMILIVTTLYMYLDAKQPGRGVFKKSRV